MSQRSPRIPRKRYLDRDEPFVLPQSTAYWKKQRERSRAREYDSQDDRFLAETQISSGDPSSSCDPALTADDVSLNSHLSSTSDSFGSDNNAGLSPEDVRPPQADDLVDDDSFDALTDAEGDTDSEASEGAQDEPSSMDETLSDCNDSFESDGDAEIGDESEEVRPTFLDESELLAEDFAHLESQNLPGSTTTKAAAVIMIMAFVITHGLSWVALDDLLSLIDGLFGFGGNTLPRTKHLFRKMWSSRTKSLVKHFFYCDDCGSLLNSQTGAKTMRCPTCCVDNDVSAFKAKGNFFYYSKFKRAGKIGNCSNQGCSL
ncbi:hypothetical protein MRX96_025809 [Rhipicephalus microplus]